ncbi:MAG: response regulator [Ardenticatenaceae bacterium]|nr:response regulator [Ardenticatenaceae bacterium]
MVEDFPSSVLIIDDDRTIRQAFTEFLAFEGIPVIQARNGAEGISLLRSHLDRIAVVILDFSMPGLSSLQTFSRMREVRADLPILLCSGYSERECDFPGAYNGFLQKPFEISLLFSTVGAYIPRVTQ